MTEAVERARSGGGPTLIEALTYRLTDHTTADDASRYRSDAEVSEHWKADPVARLRDLLVAGGHWGRQQEEQLLEQSASRDRSRRPRLRGATNRCRRARCSTTCTPTLPTAYERQHNESTALERDRE